MRGLKTGAVGVTAAAMMALAPVQDAEAQILERGLQGGVAGAIVGGIVGGGRGIGKGAAIGAGVGAVAGAIEADQRRVRRDRAYVAYPPPPPAYYDPYLIRDIQGSLYRLGYDPGPIDGQYGRGTADAIAAYQSDYGLPVNGRPSGRLLGDMRRNGG
jgi:hypothetical protein